MKLAGWGLAAAGGWAALSLLAHRSLYFPMKHPEGWWEQQGQLGAEDVWLRSADGVKLHAWWVAAPGAKVATLFLHGNAGNVTHRGHAIREIAAAGSSVLMLDYRGYGKSEGSPSENGLYADAAAGYALLLAKGYDSAHIVLHGESLGTAVAAELAAHEACGGMILEAPFPSAGAVAATIIPVVGRSLVWGFDTKSRIAGFRGRLLLVHGDRDEVIATALGREVFEAAGSTQKEFWLVAGAGHNDLVDVAGIAYRERLAKFYKW